MKLTNYQLQEIKKFVEQQVKKNDDFHKIDHIKQTVQFAKYLAKKERADENICVVSAWLHDIAKYKEKKSINHGTYGAKLSKKILSKLNLPKKDMQKICYAISVHNQSGKKKTKEAKILWDADKLQIIGVGGLLRIYAYLLQKELSSKEAYEKSRREQRYYSKKFYTRTAKQIVKKQTKSIKDFDKNYQKLISLK